MVVCVHVCKLLTNSVVIANVASISNFHCRQNWTENIQSDTPEGDTISAWHKLPRYSLVGLLLLQINS